MGTIGLNISVRHLISKQFINLDDCVTFEIQIEELNYVTLAAKFMQLDMEFGVVSLLCTSTPYLIREKFSPSKTLKLDGKVIRYKETYCFLGIANFSATFPGWVIITTRLLVDASFIGI